MDEVEEHILQWSDNVLKQVEPYSEVDPALVHLGLAKFKGKCEKIAAKKDEKIQLYVVNKQKITPESRRQSAHETAKKINTITQSRSPD